MIDSRIAPTAYREASDTPELAIAPRTVFVSIAGEGAPESRDWYRKKVVVTGIARHLATRSLAPTGAPIAHVSYRYSYNLDQLGISDFYGVHPLAELRYRVLAEVSEAATWADIAAARLAADLGNGGDGRDLGDLPGESDHLEIFTIPEQLVLQVTHTGPFSDRFATLVRLGDAARARGVSRTGPHQEIHLDAFTPGTAQDTLRTIIREPVAMSARPAHSGVRHSG